MVENFDPFRSNPKAQNRLITVEPDASRMVYCLRMRGNTVGSLSGLHALITDSEAAYIFGLWCADGYFWSSSIGITNVNRTLVNRFAQYLGKHLPSERIKLRVYHPRGKPPRVGTVATYPMRLARQVAYQLYVNSRPLLRMFQQAETQVATLPTQHIMAYFAGRFDGDGSVDKDLRSDLRITYSNRAEAETDQSLLAKLDRYGTRVYHYRGARTYILYVRRASAERFLHDIAPYSVKVQTLFPRRDSFRWANGMDGKIAITRRSPLSLAKASYGG